MKYPSLQRFGTSTIPSEMNDGLALFASKVYLRKLRKFINHPIATFFFFGFKEPKMKQACGLVYACVKRLKSLYEKLIE